MSFLKAEWRKLAIANYQVNPDLLKQYVPAHTELDLWNGSCFVSLVGFMFLNTRMLGIKFPFHVNFEEVNLRFYVRYNDGEVWKRGVVFIREIVPKPMLTLVANTIYKENYRTMPMKHDWQEHHEGRTISYQWKCKGRWNSFSVDAKTDAIEITEGSETEFITEHYWGYAQHGKKTVEYEVTHPRWKVYEVANYDINVDFGTVYGPDFTFLGDRKPDSVMLAEGSEITVESKKLLKGGGDISQKMS